MSLNLFSSKDDNHFHDALRLYESKQYKKAIRVLDSILKHNPSHYQSVSLKGLSLYHSQLPESKDAYKYIKEGADKGSKNSVVCHITALYFRAAKDYPRAAKWYNLAMKNDSPNTGIYRDLSSCLTQTRDYPALVQSRLNYLESEPGYRANWTAAAVAHCLNGHYNRAEDVLSRIEKLVVGHLTEDDMFENSECFLFKNRIIYHERGAQAALDHLKEIEDTGKVYDGLKVAEYRAQYLEELKRPKEASVEYRRLLKRNPDNATYYYDLERCLGTDKMDQRVRLALYEKLAQFYPRSDPPQFIPLTFLTGDLFAQQARKYVLAQLQRGVPATFVNVKPLYRRKSNIKVLYTIVREFYDAEKAKLAGSDASHGSNPLSLTWAGYFLAQHYYRIGELDQAMSIIDSAIDVTPTLVELYIVKARILKRMGQLDQACEWMDQARKMDLQDRFINTKAIKYYVRADKIDKAVDTASLFTRNEGAPNGVRDLHLMQCVWFLIESAECYYRLYEVNQKKWRESSIGEKLDLSDDSNVKHEDILAHEHLKKQTIHMLGLAVKRYKAVLKVYEEFEDDQFDFHHYSMRKGTPRTYLTMIKWEDNLYHQPVFLRAARGITRIYAAVKANPAWYQALLADPSRSLQRTKKEKKDESHAREESVKYARGYAKDTDVFGESILKELAGIPDKETERRLAADDADYTQNSFGDWGDRGTVDTRFKALAEKVDDHQSIDSQYIVFRVNQIYKKFVMSLKSMGCLAETDATNPDIGYMLTQLKIDQDDESVAVPIRRILGFGLKKAYKDIIESTGDEFMGKVASKFFARNDLATGRDIVETKQLQSSKELDTRLGELEKSLDLCSLHYLKYDEM